MPPSPPFTSLHMFFLLWIDSSYLNSNESQTESSSSPDRNGKSPLSEIDSGSMQTMFFLDFFHPSLFPRFFSTQCEDIFLISDQHSRDIVFFFFLGKKGNRQDFPWSDYVFVSPFSSPFYFSLRSKRVEKNIPYLSSLNASTFLSSFNDES